MFIAAIKEQSNEQRVAILPPVVEKYKNLGFEVGIETGLAAHLNIKDDLFQQNGAVVEPKESLLAKADIVIRVNKPDESELGKFKQGVTHVSFLDPFFNQPLVQNAAQHDINLISMELIPRLTYAQKMDALSSQANLAGYAAVLIASMNLKKAFPMMMTAAGTISPAKVFVIGAGVAGLQAIATAKRLGANIQAFDTRPEVEEQVKSLGARFVKVDLGQTEQTQQGYAKALTPEQMEKQKQAMAKVCAESDVVITTAQLFGRKAPIVVTDQILQQMQPGSVVIDLAVTTGGNVEGSQVDQIANVHGVNVIGYSNIHKFVAKHASQMYANNLYNLIETAWSVENGNFQFDREHEIVKGCLVTFDKQVVNEMVLKAYQN